MNIQEDVAIQCPYCGQNMQIQVTRDVPQQNYIEDCQVCCRAMCLVIDIEGTGRVSVLARRDDE